MLISDLIENSYRHHTARGKLSWARETWRIWKQHILPIIGDGPADKLSTKHQELYRSKRASEGACPSTINRELQALRRAYKLGAQHEPPMVSRVPYFLMAKLNDARKVFIDMNTLGRLRSEASRHSPWMRCAVELAFNFGWRRGEIVGLKVGDVDLFDGSVRLQTSKNGEPREAPITATLRPFLEPLVLGRKPTEPLLGQSLGTFSYQWRAVRKLAGAENFIFHDFRRTSARIKRQVGVPTSVIMELQGWKTEAMFRRYCITSREDKADALRKQEEWEALRAKSAAAS